MCGGCRAEAVEQRLGEKIYHGVIMSDTIDFPHSVVSPSDVDM